VSTSSGSAPGRLDLLGGVADYSGALVLELPTQVATTVTATPADRFTVGPATFRVDELAALARRPYPDVRRELAPHPRWTHYVVGVAVVLTRHDVISPPAVALTVTSDVPVSVGVSSSAALEVATARAIGGDGVDPLRLAALCQEAENHVVGAPCGIMDQVAVAVGTPGALLPILCRPATRSGTQPASVQRAVMLPPDVEVVGWPTGAEHDVGGVPYGRARAAAFMGKRMVEDACDRTWSWVSELPQDAVADLPETVDGAAFLDRWGATGDDVTAVEPAATYPVRAATRFGVEEHARTRRALAHLRRGEVAELGALLAASHAGYDAMGLGHPAATATVAAALARPGVHGARSSGGGCGGTVVVLCDRGALDTVDGLVR
jgi:L-arabinokinase